MPNEPLGWLRRLRGYITTLANTFKMGFAKMFENSGETISDDWQHLAGIGTFTWLRDSGETTWSAELCRMLGHDPSKGTPDIETRRSHFPRNIRTEIWPGAMRTIENGSSFTLDADLIRNDGSTFGAMIRVAQLTDAAGTVIGVQGFIQDITERRRREERLVEAATRCFGLQDDERRTIARDLHDQTAQNLALLSINLTLLERAMPNADDKIKELLLQSSELVGRASEEVRRLSYKLHPPLLEDAGLVPALNWYIEGFSAKSGIKVGIVDPGAASSIEPSIQATLYRVVQECLNNIKQHTDSGTANIAFGCDNGSVKLSVCDEGNGFPTELNGDGLDYQKYAGVGLRDLQRRVQSIGGQLKITSDRNGTQVSVEIPIRKEEG